MIETIVCLHTTFHGTRHDERCSKNKNQKASRSKITNEDEHDYQMKLILQALIASLMSSLHTNAIPFGPVSNSY